MKSLPIFAGICLFISVFSGCASHMDQNIADVNSRALKAASAYNSTEHKDPGVSDVARPRISGDAVFVGANGVNDQVFDTNFIYYTKGVQTLSQVLTNVSRIVGKSINAREVAVGEISAKNQESNALEGTVNIEFRGPLRAFFDKICEQNDLSWRYANGQIEIYKYESRVYHIALPNGKKDVSSSISLSESGGSGASGGSSSGGNVSVTSALSISPWNSVIQGISSILMSEGLGTASATANTQQVSNLSAKGRFGYAVANPDLGIITVTARPSYLDRVGSYLDSINQRFAQNILVDIRVFSVTLNDEFSAGFSLEGVVDQINWKGAGLALDKLTLSGPAILAPISGVTPGSISVDTTYYSHNFQTTANTVLQALKGLGSASLQTQGQIVAINGQPAPFQVANEENYVASSSKTTTDVGITSSLETKTKVTGFTANFIPMILGDNRILLQYQMQISSLDKMVSLTQGDGTVIQLPKVSSQTLQQQTFMQDGQTLMLFSFAQDKNQSNNNLGILTTSRNGARDKQLLVIMLHLRSTGDMSENHEIPN